MIIDCISDLHGYLPDLPGGDLLIVAGDCTASDEVPQWVEFYNWFKTQDYRKKVLVAGNHDGFLTHCIPTAETRLLGVDLDDDWYEYLCDSFTVFEGVKIYGSPWTPLFYDWHFMLKRGEQIKQKWDLIPSDTNILVTHGPPHGVLDRTNQTRWARDPSCGCEELKIAIERVKPKLHVFGHIHGSYDTKPKLWDDDSLTWFANCSHCNEDYEPVNEPIRFEYSIDDGLHSVREVLGPKGNPNKEETCFAQLEKPS